MKSCIALILGGGRGTRLFPLTKDRAKPAVPMGGKYRLVDIAISNCLASGFERIFILTQFNSASLNRHIFRTYKFSEFSHGFIEILPAGLSSENTDWYQGTADAVRQNLQQFRFPELENYLIMGGDQLFRMDLHNMLRNHQRNGSDITIAVIPVSADMISRFGIVRLDQHKKIISYREKPPMPSEIKDMVGDRSQLPEGLDHPLPTPFYWASMGIYLIKKKVLEYLLRNLKGDDFEHDIIPAALQSYTVTGFLYTGYWEDLGTIPSFYQANLAMISQRPPVNLYDNQTTVYTRQRHLPPSLIINSKIEGGLVAEGAQIFNCTVKNTIVGVRSLIKSGTVIEDSILMGADFFEPELDPVRSDPSIRIPVGIGEGTLVRRAIIDKNVRMGRNVIIDNKTNLNFADHSLFHIRDGIIVVPKNTVIPDNTVLPPIEDTMNPDAHD
ncbi:glucose-1-phosphate adenylyltransferase [bacterium]|nr:glucose-1-phosphate adenylyltransferase [bacterium]